VAEGVAFLRSKDSAKGAKGLTQQEAIAESIYALDSSQLDPVSNFSAGSPQYVEAKARARKGQLQQIQSMKESFFGGNGRKGLFDRLREAPPEEK
jgi:hypothetical protein